jgi:hypothetical protein
VGPVGQHDAEGLKDLADTVRLLHRVTQGPVRTDRVVVTPTVALTFQVPGSDKLAHDPLGGPLGDPDLIGQVADPNLWVPSDADQGMPVIGEERPLGHIQTLRPAPHR